ncbi:protein-tyrosine phosphatase [Tranquillimonas rosea]|uniref:protein-tyrosine-phosphatase n=1 Tax=Tranquillimonas rosea TaxID=641238 RepID=A0A1H9RGB9_9RHOB|nr:low molecular weight protein-tyrosine-phosphatase [Tranquillimonas rosea]SER71850.1 protein-tyrosine phosphatase [Tranquillimonas rosea]
MSDTPSVLFVCLGNICRSPLAEAAFRAAAERAGLEVEVDSAGTGAWHLGDAPDPRAQAIAREHGLDISGYRARKVTRADYDRFDHMIALDEDNYETLHIYRPEGARAQVTMLLDHVPGREREPVADPYYGGPGGFESTWEDVSAGAAGLLQGMVART